MYINNNNAVGSHLSYSLGLLPFGKSLSISRSVIHDYCVNACVCVLVSMRRHQKCQVVVCLQKQSPQWLLYAHT